VEIYFPCLLVLSHHAFKRFSMPVNPWQFSRFQSAHGQNVTKDSRLPSESGKLPVAIRAQVICLFLRLPSWCREILRNFGRERVI
jgi:hypothetical protein